MSYTQKHWWNAKLKNKNRLTVTYEDWIWFKKEILIPVGYSPSIEHAITFNTVINSTDKLKIEVFINEIENKDISYNHDTNVIIPIRYNRVDSSYLLHGKNKPLHFWEMKLLKEKMGIAPYGDKDGTNRKIDEGQPASMP